MVKGQRLLEADILILSTKSQVRELQDEVLEVDVQKG